VFRATNQERIYPVANGYRVSCIAWIGLCVIAGCSRTGPQFVPADGTLTFEGKPLSGATVTFVPEKGPVAMGITDSDGKFSLSSGSHRGIVVGQATVSITILPPTDEPEKEVEDFSKAPQSEEEAAEFRKKAAEMVKKNRAEAKKPKPKPKLIIPEKFAKSETSGLSYPIKANGDNHFKIEL